MPILQGVCTEEDNLYGMVSYYGEFPSKLANMNPVVISGAKVFPLSRPSLPPLLPQIIKIMFSRVQGATVFRSI
jgi:hypothetical protein